jgi:hypothetical protein
MLADFANSSSQWVVGLAALTYKNRENDDKIHADNLVKRSGVRIYRKKNILKNILKKKHLINLKTYRHPYLDVNLSKHVNKHPIHLGTPCSPFKQEAMWTGPWNEKDLFL